MAHYTRFHGPMPPVEEARAVARAAADVGVRVTLALFLRDRNPLVYSFEDSVMAKLPERTRATIEAQFLGPMPGVEDQIARVEAIAAEVEGPSFSVQFGPNGPQWCSDALLAAIAERSRATGRRVHMHLLETRCQRAFADRAYPEGVVRRLEALGLLSPRLTLAHCVHAREDELQAIAEFGRGDRDQPQLEPSSQERRRADRRGDPARLPGRDRRRRLGLRRGRRHFARDAARALSCTAAGASTASSSGASGSPAP